MVKHIVMWKMADIDDKNQRAADIKTQLELLKNKIEVIVDIEVGINFNTSDAASDVVLVSTFKSKEDLAIYQDHPAHKSVGSDYVRPYVKERRVADYEF